MPLTKSTPDCTNKMDSGLIHNLPLNLPQLPPTLVNMDMLVLPNLPLLAVPTLQVYRNQAWGYYIPTIGLVASNLIIFMPCAAFACIFIRWGTKDEHTMGMVLVSMYCLLLVLGLPLVNWALNRTLNRAWYEEYLEKGEFIQLDRKGCGNEATGIGC